MVSKMRFDVFLAKSLNIVDNQWLISDLIRKILSKIKEC